MINESSHRSPNPNPRWSRMALLATAQAAKEVPQSIYPVPPVKTAYSKFSPTDNISIEMDPLDLTIKISMQNYKIS